MYTGRSQCAWILWFLSVNTPLTRPHLFFSWEWRAEGQVMTSISPHQCGSSRRDGGGRQETTPPLVETLYWLSIYNVIYPGFLVHPLSLLLKTSLWVKTFITRFLMWHHCASHFSGVCVLLNFALFWLICSRVFEFHFRLSVIFYNSLPNYYFSGTCKNCFFLFFFSHGGFSVSVIFEILAVNMYYMWVCEQKN